MMRQSRRVKRGRHVSMGPMGPRLQPWLCSRLCSRLSSTGTRAQWAVPCPQLLLLLLQPPWRQRRRSSCGACWPCMPCVWRMCRCAPRHASGGAAACVLHLPWGVGTAALCMNAEGWSCVPPLACRLWWLPAPRTLHTLCAAWLPSSRQEPVLTLQGDLCASAPQTHPCAMRVIAMRSRLLRMRRPPSRLPVPLTTCGGPQRSACCAPSTSLRWGPCTSV